MNNFKILKKFFNEYQINSRISEDFFNKLRIPNDKDIYRELNSDLRCLEFIPW